MNDSENFKREIVYITLGKITDKELYNKIVYKTTQCAEFMFQHDWWLYEQDGEPSINITTTVEFLYRHNLLELLNHTISRQHLEDCRSSYIPTSCIDLYFALKEEKENNRNY